MGECIEPGDGIGDNIYYHKLVYSFEQHGGSGGPDALLNGPNEALNFRDMFLFGCTVQVYDQSGHLLA